ncbi:MAG: carbon-nitrogen hydrolase family protein [Clostridia bacterium]|nr:carbon-nitrogen hydrolase family protein [Clostridia bacterium]
MKIALLQTPVGFDKQANVDNACAQVREAAQSGARLVVLPEMFCCPYSAQYFVPYAEPAGGPVWQAMSRCAAENGICLVAGSMPERDGGRVYNTSFVFGPDGSQLARHRKMHLFDVAFDGGQFFRESDTFTPGEEVTTFDFEGITFGLCICFDFRFPELSRLMALRGARAIIVPAAFNMTTGPLHWETMFRQRATDDQVYTVGVAPARDEHGVYVSYANSILCSPLGQILTRAEADSCILYSDLDPDAVSAARRQLPLFSARRTDIYTVCEQK